MVWRWEVGVWEWEVKVKVWVRSEKFGFVLKEVARAPASMA